VGKENMKKWNSKSFSLALIITTLIIASSGIITPKVFATARIHIVPSNIDNPSLGPGSTFIVNASVDNIVDLYTWQVQIEFDPTILNCLSIWIPLNSKFNFPVQPPPTIDNNIGFAILGASLIYPPGVSGSDTLVSLEFKVVGRGISPIKYSEPIGVNTFFLDHTQFDIPVTVENGSFNNWVPPPPATFYINPPRVVDPTLINGSTFNISLSIRDATNVHFWKAKILYSKSILNATAVTEGTFLKSVGSTTFSFGIRDFNATHGLVDMNCSLTTGGANGAGELATITFEVLDLGESRITILEADLRDPSNMALPFNTVNGYFSNILMAKLSIEPSEVRGPEYVPGTTFSINVTLDDVENLKKCILNLTYIPSVILEISVNVPSVLGQTPIKKLQIDDEAGYIWAQITYPNQVTTYNPVTIMHVEFQVVAMGVSPINLTGTQLYDTGGASIVHEVYNGMFIGLIRDVAVVSVLLDLNIAYEGWIVNVNVTVRNKGNLTETFDVKIYYEGNPAGIGTVVDLPPNEETTITIAWNTKNVAACHNYTISATAGPVPYEFNTADNTLTDGKVKIRIMGDVNGDGIVDMRDINYVCNHYGGQPRGSSKSLWDPLADFNRDGRIDLRDIGICCNNFQRHC
jgi:hypothetical protein